MPFGTRLTRLRGPLGLVTAIGVGAAVFAPALVVAQQQPQRPQRPAPQAPQPQAPQASPQMPGQAAQQGQAGGPTVVQVKPEPSQTDWTKVCGKDQASNAEICYTTRDFVSDQGQPVLAVAVYDVKGGNPQQAGQKIVRFLLPLGLILQPGIRFAVDQGQPTAGRYAICFPNGCFAEQAGLKDDVINQLKRGTNLNVSVQNPAAARSPSRCPSPASARRSMAPRSIRRCWPTSRRSCRRSSSAAATRCASASSRAARPARRAPPPPPRPSSKRRTTGPAFFTRVPPDRSVGDACADAIATAAVDLEHLVDLGVPQRLAGHVGQEVLLRDVGDVFGLLVLGEEMVERLVLRGPDLLGDRQPPFLGVAERRIDVEDHAAEREDPVLDDLPDREFGVRAGFMQEI